LVTLQSASTCNLWVANNSDWNQPTQVTTGSRLDGRNGVAYMTGGQVVYSSSVGGSMDLWVMNADASNQRQLTANSRNNTQPVITRDGRYVIFSSDRSGTANVWRVDIDGTLYARWEMGGIHIIGCWEAYDLACVDRWRRTGTDYRRIRD
jgi:Tol biopolymer transport system component